MRLPGYLEAFSDHKDFERQSALKAQASYPLTSLRGLSVNSDYEKGYGTWTTPSGPIPVASTYRIAWRRMAATTGFRTLYPAIIPPGALHVHPVNSAGKPGDNRELLKVGAAFSSLILDFRIRSGGASEIQSSQAELLPIPDEGILIETLIRLYLQLNCLTSAYAPLWKDLTSTPWTKDLPLRKSIERRSAQIEIDAIVALSLGVTADELCMIYRTQFPVMRRYDQEDLFDRNGRRLPKEVMVLHRKLKDGEELTQEHRTWIHPQSGTTYSFEYPFQVLDREKDLRAAYLKYEKYA